VDHGSFSIKLYRRKCDEVEQFKMICLAKTEFQMYNPHYLWLCLVWIETNYFSKEMF